MGIEEEPKIMPDNEITEDKGTESPLKRRKKKRGLGKVKPVKFQVPEEVASELDEAELLGKGRLPQPEPEEQVKEPGENQD